MDEEPSTSTEVASADLCFSQNDPLGLNDLSETQLPSYSYSLDDGLHNFVFTVNSGAPKLGQASDNTSNSSPFVISGQSFGVAPLIKAAEPTTSSSSSTKSFTLVPLASKVKNNHGSRLIKNTREYSSLSKTKNKDSACNSGKVDLACEWENCDSQFTDLHAFLEHVAEHASDIPIISTKIATETANESEPKELIDEGERTFGCLWQDCGFETAESGEMVRHLNFHSFHTNIKANGTQTLQDTKVEPCNLPRDQRNVLPQLPDCDFICQWNGCERSAEVFGEPIKFYWHVQWHAEEYRPSKLAFGRSATAARSEKKDIICKWQNCNFKAGSTFKLKDHLKSHSAERAVACPNCGGLFASRSKFFDHCQRQLKVEKGLKCSYCQKTFPSERLLRDHMRSHINTYQCPLCTMTCPSATAMNKHITYRHSDERSFTCPFAEEDEEFCDYKGKTVHDLNKHLKNVHYGQNFFKCDQDGCEKTFRSRTSLKFHIEKVHENLGPKYCCHFCKKRFRRGNYLTSHLSSVHDYKWPPGFKKFHYTMDENGLYHVQTMRFESFDLPTNGYDGTEMVT